MTNKQINILLVDDDETIIFSCEHALSKSGYTVSTARNLKEAQASISTTVFDALLLDLKLPDGNSLEWIPDIKTNYPDMPIIVITGTGDIPTAVKAMKSGAENFLTKPIEIDTLELSLKTALELGELRRQSRIQTRLAKNKEPFFGASPSIASVQKQLKIAAASETVLLIQGETGTGKGILAKWIHDNSERRRGSFVELNCSSLQGDLLRSELFGHAKGSFTSAVSDREGLVEMADGGTLFLDEIGDMEPTVQTQFLKTIEERTYRRIGENKLRKSDFRLICATNKNLTSEIESGKFRNDLYYRICVFPIHIPPLRERTEDILDLTNYLLHDFGQNTIDLSPEVIALLTSYSWPGNIRELRNVLERALLLKQSNPLSPHCFPGLVHVSSPLDKNVVEQNIKLHDIERNYLVQVVESCKGDKVKASKLLGISLATLYRKLGKKQQNHQPAEVQ